MKYPREVYSALDMYGDSCDISAYTDKVVKCRKEHKCATCERTISKGQFAISESGFLDGEPVSAYTCIECAESLIEESGEYDTDYDEYLRVKDECGIIWHVTMMIAL